jgi:hypothetical protein
METYTPAPETTPENRHAETDEARRRTPTATEPAKPEPPAREEPVTPYDHLWFERRPLS